MNTSSSLVQNAIVPENTPVRFRSLRGLVHLVGWFARFLRVALRASLFSGRGFSRGAACLLGQLDLRLPRSARSQPPHVLAFPLRPGRPRMATASASWPSTSLGGALACSRVRLDTPRAAGRDARGRTGVRASGGASLGLRADRACRRDSVRARQKRNSRARLELAGPGTVRLLAIRVWTSAGSVVGGTHKDPFGRRELGSLAVASRPHGTAQLCIALCGAACAAALKST